MSGPTEATKGSAQIIRDSSGNPLYAVVPFDEYQALLDADGHVTIPHEVVDLMIEKNVAQAEKMGNKPHIETLRSWARVLGCDVAQLTELTD